MKNTETVSYNSVNPRQGSLRRRARHEQHQWIKLLAREELEDAIGFKLGSKTLLVTFHPVTLDEDSAWVQMQELLKALRTLGDTRLIFTMPNADTGNKKIAALIKEFVADHAGAVAFPSLGQLRYLSCMQHVDAVVGNSSSGLLEAPSFKKATINIGDRQKGRVQAESVIDCSADKDSIRSAIKEIYSPFSKKSWQELRTPMTRVEQVTSSSRQSSKSTSQGFLKRNSMTSAWSSPRQMGQKKRCADQRTTF